MRGNRTIWQIAAALAMAIGVVALLPAIAWAQTPAATSAWTAAMKGANENPPTTSAATATFNATVDEAAGTITWSLSVPTITNGTAAHLHTGAAGVNGAIVLPLFAAPTNAPVASINVSGVSKASDLTGPMAGDFKTFVAALKAGTIYANVHTSANPGGEIRAQVVAAAAGAVVAPVAAVPAKTGNAGLVGTGASADQFQVVLLLLLAGIVVAGGRALTRDEHR